MTKIRRMASLSSLQSSWVVVVATMIMSWSPVVVVASDTATSSASKLPPPFFLQDPNDSLCLSGEEFKRCSVDTLWYATGTAGAYQIHKRPVDGGETTEAEDDDDGLCLSRKSCKDADLSKTLDLKVAKCSHCGSKGWTILGDNNVGYTISAQDGQTCIARQATDDGGHDKAVTAPCDDAAAPPAAVLQLQFASAADIVTLSSPGAQLVAAATDGDLARVQAVLATVDDVNAAVDWDGLNALIPAASAGHLELVQYLTSPPVNINVNAADKDGITALMEASIMGHTAIVEYLLQQEALTVDQAAQSGITALWLAASEGHVDIAKLLLDKGGADASVARVDDISALQTAAVGGHLEMVQLLLSQPGVSATAVDKEGLTPLHNAAEKGNVAVVQALLDSIKEDDAEEKTALVNQFSNTGFTAIIIAAAHGHADVVAALLDHGANAMLGCQDTGVTALMYAAANKQMDVVKVLLEKHAGDKLKEFVDQTHKGGGTALIEAGTGGAVDAMKLLIEEGGADVNAKDDDGVSPLMAIASACVLEGQHYIWNLMQEKGLAAAELNRMSFSGGTPIMFAAAGGYTECVQHFLDLGAHVNVRSKATPEYLAKLAANQAANPNHTPADHERHVDDVTPLHVAAQGGHLECAQALIDAGADVTLIDVEGRTALQVAISGNYGQVALALVQAGSNPNTPYTDDEGVAHNLLFDAVMVENVEFAKALIAQGADIYYQDDKHVSTLLQASHRGLTDVAELLLQAHQKSSKAGSTYLDDASDEGVTPLISAAAEGHEALVKLLLEAGANALASDSDGTTALMAAAARGHLGIVQLLVQHNGEASHVNAQNKDGHTALMFAYNGKNQVQTLAERYQQFQDENTQSGSESSSEPQDGGTGPLIKEALANHTALVDYLLTTAGADASLQDKEGHAARDFDYQADHPAVFAKDSSTATATDSATKNDEL